MLMVINEKIGFCSHFNKCTNFIEVKSSAPMETVHMMRQNDFIYISTHTKPNRQQRSSSEDLVDELLHAVGEEAAPLLDLVVHVQNLLLVMSHGTRQLERTHHLQRLFKVRTHGIDLMGQIIQTKDVFVSKGLLDGDIV